MPKSPPPADIPITEDDAFIARMLERASIPTLMMSMIHMSGDASLLDGSIRPGAATLGETQGGLTAEDKASVRERALEIVKGYRDRGCDLPAPPTPKTIRRMLSFVVGQEVSDEYVPMMLEEMALDGDDSRDIEWKVSDEAKQAFPVLVIGAGMSGLLAAIRLQESGIPYTIVEKNDGVGGTWYENTYPGCRVDVSNHFYCYSFEPNHDWSEYFSQQEELGAYFDRCARKYGVRDRIRFRTEVTSCRFDESTSRWKVTLCDGDGREEAHEFAAIISGVGQLNRPRIPEFEGIESFEGPAFHSSQWEHEHDLSDKRVAVIGTGASAFQLVPEVAKAAKHTVVFQRSPAWMLPNPDYHRRVSDEVKWLLKHIPYYSRWYRFMLFWPGSDGLLPSLRVDPEWPHPERSVNAMNEMTREYFIAYMREQLGGDEELLAKATPSYPPFGKRILQDNGTWLATLKRDDVDLVTDGIARITANGVVTDAGEEVPVDLIVFATGFHANRYLFPIDVVGRGGVHLADEFGDDPRAYLGITVPKFPNLFCLYGPATNLAHAGSIIFHSECQVRYIMGCIEQLLERGAATLECKEDVNREYNERLDAEHRGLVWSHPGMKSWYKNSAGRVTTTSPWRLADYWRWTFAPNPEDFDWR